MTRTDRFLERIDKHLAHVPTRQQRTQFLCVQLAAWERAYARFVASDGASEPTSERDPPHAADFTLTIAGLAARLEQENYRAAS